MAQVYNTGACFVYAGIGSGNAPVFVGTGERAPRQRIQRFWSPLFNDLAGDQDSFDDLYQGQRGMVIVRLSRWKQVAVNFLQSIPLAAGLPGGTGVDALGDVGTAMVTEGLTFPLWVLYDYGASGRFPKAAFANGANGAMPPGRRWLAARLEGPDDETAGTQPNYLDLVFVCKRVYDSSTGNLSLWDRNTAGLPAPD